MTLLKPKRENVIKAQKFNHTTLEYGVMVYIHKLKRA